MLVEPALCWWEAARGLVENAMGQFKAVRRDQRRKAPEECSDSIFALRYGDLSDRRSCEEFARQLQWRCTLDQSGLPAEDPASDTFMLPALSDWFR